MQHRDLGLECLSSQASGQQARSFEGRAVSTCEGLSERSMIHPDVDGGRQGTPMISSELELLQIMVSTLDT